MSLALDHLVLTVQDLAATRQFYEAGLGMQLVQFGDEQAQWALQFGRQKINLHVVGQDIRPKAAVPLPGTGDFCLLTDEPVEALAARLEKLGFPPFLGPVARTGATGPLRSIYLRDPDGNLVELANPA